MHTRKYILTFFTTLTALLMMVVSLPVCSQEIALQDTLLVDDSLAVDTIVTNDPEWYVAPMTHDLTRAPFRAPAAACPIDSVRTFNVDSVLESVSVYEYGDTTRTMIWAVNLDGSRYGSGREESVSTASSTYKATYAWDKTTNDWAGVSREEHYFAAGKDTAWLVYAWVNNAWVVNTKYTYVYDAAGREVEFTSYQRNAATGELAYSKQRIREYDASGKTTLDIQYTAHNGSAWSAGTKKVYDYDASNNQVLYEYYSAYTNGTWVGSSKEIWTYTAGKKTYYEKDTWSNGAWVGSSKEIWVYNGPSAKQTLHEKYGWTNGDWAISLQENSGYDAAGNNTLVEKYTYANGVKTGSKEEYVFVGTKKTETVKYKWVDASSAWVEISKAVNNVDAAGNVVETANYLWVNDAWRGNGNRVLKTYNDAQKVTEQITQSWSTDVASWVNSSRKTTEYSGAKTTQEATYTWSTETNDWVGTSRSDWHYNAKGQNDTIKTYTNNGSEWIYSNRTVNFFNAAGTNIMTHNAQWNGEKWVMTSMTRTDILDHTVDGLRQTLNASWKCNADSVWTGVTKDSTAYTESGKTLYRIHCEGWTSNDWIPKYKIEYEYDETDHVIVQQQLDWVSGSWKGFYRYEYNYDAEGRQTTYASYNSWNTTYNNWVGSSKTKYVYDSDGQIVESMSYAWKNNDWAYTQKYVYTYDSQKRTIQYVFQLYTNGAWVNAQKNEKDYAGDVLSKNNTYIWLNDQWVFNSRNETYYDNDAQAKLRREIIGYWSNGVVSSFADNYYCYACDPHAFTIRFENENGVLLESQEVKNGAMPVYGGEKPTKENTAQYTYSFKGWDKAIVAATGDATYVATYDSVVNAYLITFKNGEEVLQSEVLAYGKVPTYDGEKPAKQSNAQYTYSFKGWDAEIVAVTGEATYSAMFDSIVNTYLVTFKNGESILQSTEVEYGVAPVYTGEMPSRPATAEYTYSFKGWDAEIVAVTGEATYSAMFDSIVNTYLVTFKNGESILQSTEVEYGVAPVYTGEMPSRPATAEYTYSFKGWDAELAAVTGAATYNAVFDTTVNTYLVTFMNGDVTLQSGQVAYGTVPTYNGQTPTKDGNEQHSYVFAGWDAELVAVTGEATYTATFTVTEKTYVITWLNNDGSEIGRDTLKYGATPTPAEATKENTAEFTYTFTGWDKTIVPVAGDATYTAQYDSVRNKYTITFYFDDGKTVVETMVVEYGQMPDPTKTPSKIAEEHSYYTFAGWEPALAPVTGDASYKAVFEVVPQEYLITFKNYNGVVLQKKNVAYGTIPEYTGATPTKPRTQQYSYTFAGWSPELTEVSGAATYTARYEDVLNQYTIIFVDEDGTELERQEVEYGKKPVYQGETPVKAEDEQHTYTFAGWTPAIVAVTKNATYRATYTPHDKLQGLWDVQDGAATSTKVIRNGTLYIIRAGKTYTTDGVLIEQ